MAGFADAGDDHPAARRDKHVNRLAKSVIKAVRQLHQCFCFGANDAAGGI